MTLLDGLPLAIELAAARVTVMPPKTLLERMSQRFRLLTSSGGRRDRQATLRGALDWSWDLLSNDEQSALAQISVFEGGFTLEAAAEVLELAELWPEDAVQALLGKSLVRRTSDERFDLLVSVQEYAAEKLDDLGAREAAELRHGAWCAAFGTDEALQSLRIHGGVARLRALAAELDNLVAATRRAIARSDGETAAATLRAAWLPLSMRGPYAVAEDLATAALALPDLAPATSATLADVLGTALQASGRGEEARAHYEEALAIHRELGDRRTEGAALRNLGSLRRIEGRPDGARAHYRESLAIAREVGDRDFEGLVLGNLGNLHLSRGRPDEARACFEEALAIAREIGHRRFESVVLGNLGLLHTNQGRPDAAWAHFDEALAIHRDVGDRRIEGQVLGNLGLLHMNQGRPDDARTHYEEALAIHREVGNRGFEGQVLGSIGVLHLNQGRPDEAQAHHEEALAIAREVGDRRLEGNWLGSLGKLLAAQGRSDQARAAFDAGEALLRVVEDPDLLGQLLCGRGLLEHTDGNADEAQSALTEAEQLATKLAAGPDSELGREIAKTRAALETP